MENREDRIEYIQEKLPDADDFVLEQICDFLQEVEYCKEVIRDI